MADKSFKMKNNSSWVVDTRDMLGGNEDIPHAARYPMTIEMGPDGWYVKHGPMSEQELKEHVEEDLKEENEEENNEEEEEEEEHKDIIHHLVKIIKRLVDILAGE